MAVVPHRLRSGEHAAKVPLPLRGGRLVAIMSPPLFCLHLVGPKRCPSGDIWKGENGRFARGGRRVEGGGQFGAKFDGL